MDWTDTTTDEEDPQHSEEDQEADTEARNDIGKAPTGPATFKVGPPKKAQRIDGNGGGK